MRDILVSCIVPVFNGERFLASAVASIQAQRVPDREIIVVDDGSTDTTPAVIADFGPSVRSIRQANQGPAAARNAGVSLARGSFIAFLDADDCWVPDKLERQLARFRARPELEISFAHFRNVQAEDSIAGDPLLDPALWPVSPFSPCSFLGRRAVFETVGLFDPTLHTGEDTDWFMRAMVRGLCYEVMPDVLVERRIHRRNLSRSNPPSHATVLKTIKQVLDRRRAEGW